MAATSFSGVICFSCAFANMQSVSTHLQMSAASVTRVSRLPVEGLSVGFPIAGRTSALRVLSQSLIQTSCMRDQAVHISTTVICVFNAQLLWYVFAVTLERHTRLNVFDAQPITRNPQSVWSTRPRAVPRVSCDPPDVCAAHTYA